MTVISSPRESSLDLDAESTFTILALHWLLQ
jgi:hypothetical protein